MSSRLLNPCLAMTCSLLLSHSILAEDTFEQIRWSGFATTGATYSDSETVYIEQIDEDGSFKDTRLGLNISTHYGNNWQLAGQLLMAGREGDFNAHADWIFAKYQFNDNAALLFGKMKYPNLLFSEFYDAGTVYLWSRVPQEVYNLAPGGAGAAFETIEGASLLLSAYPGEIEYVFQPYVGTAPMEDGELEQFVGFMISATADDFQLKAGYNRGEMLIGEGGHGGHGSGGGDEEESVFHDFGGASPDKTIASISASAAVGPLELIAEFVRSEIDGFSSLDIDAWYATVAVPLEKLTPHITFASMEVENGRKQTSITLGINYHVSPAINLKFDLQSIDVDAADIAVEEHMAEESEHVGEESEEAEEADHEAVEAEHADAAPAGLFFSATPHDDRVNVFTVTIDFAF